MPRLLALVNIFSKISGSPVRVNPVVTSRTVFLPGNAPSGSIMALIRSVSCMPVDIREIGAFTHLIAAYAIRSGAGGYIRAHDRRIGDLAPGSIDGHRGRVRGGIDLGSHGGDVWTGGE